MCGNLYRSISSAMLVLAAVAVFTRVSRGNPDGVCQPTWTALGTGIDGQVFSSTVFDPDWTGPDPPVLVVGGSFTSARWTAGQQHRDVGRLGMASIGNRRRGGRLGARRL
jgi:hypothetical protein